MTLRSVGDSGTSCLPHFSGKVSELLKNEIDICCSECVFIFSLIIIYHRLPSITLWKVLKIMKHLNAVFIILLKVGHNITRDKELR